MLARGHLERDIGLGLADRLDIAHDPDEALVANGERVAGIAGWSLVRQAGDGGGLHGVQCSQPRRRKLWRALCVAPLLLCTALALAGSSAGAAPTAAPYVDGISDQSLAAWDGGFSSSAFAAYLSSRWIAAGHIRYARYVVQWNIMSESSDGPSATGDYRERFEAWYRDAARLGLTLDLSLAAYTGGLPALGEYETQLGELLRRFTSIRYLEAWDEPNDVPGMTPSRADLYTNVASSLCDGRAYCTVIAGNLLDSPDMLSYEASYEKGLDPAPAIWGVHPYHAVERRSERVIAQFVELLPDHGAGEQVWFTEVGAYDCWRGVRYGEAAQAAGAAWLTRTLMPGIGPAHVFYYEFLYQEGRQPPCDPTSADSALYVPGAGPGAPDLPRAAASYIFASADLPAAFTGAAVALGAGGATLTGAVYPGMSAASYHFEYGPSTSYGGVSREGDAASADGGLQASVSLGGLTTGATYHYRLVAWNVGGSDGLGFGADREFVAGGAELLAFGPNAARELVSFGEPARPVV